MADDADLVAHGVSDAGTEVVRVVLAAQARFALRLGAKRQGLAMNLSHSRTVPGEKGHHLAVPGVVRQLIAGRADEEERPWTRL